MLLLHLGHKEYSVPRTLSHPLPAKILNAKENSQEFVSFYSYRGLLDDNNFHQHMTEISQEPVPYFRQLLEARHATSSRRSSSSSQSSNQFPSGEQFGGELEQIPLTTQVRDTLVKYIWSPLW